MDGEPPGVDRGMTFLAELELAPTDPETVEFRYVIDDSVRLSLLRAWWEQLGSPLALDVTVVPAEID